MKLTPFIFLILILSERSFCQERIVEVKLADNVKLTFVKDTFNPIGRHVEISGNTVISIDNGLVFGTDGEIPRSYLKKGTLTIDSQTFTLQVDGMFNPWHQDFFNDRVFKLIRDGGMYRIQGGFSDGAGYYGVEWVAYGQGCTRTILTNDEKIIFEYMDQ